MAVRPPRDDRPSPDAVEFGIAALDARLADADIDYPATEAEVLDAVEDHEIPFDTAGHSLDLGEALAEVPRRRFESEAELQELLHPVFESRRAAVSRSLLGRLRALLPF